MKEKFEFLKNYNTSNVSDKKNKNLVSVVKSSHNDKKDIKLKDLEKYLKNFNKHVSQKYKIHVDIVGLLETDPAKVIKVLDSDKN